jgi:hypothetical protein
VLGGDTLWHLQTFLQYIKYIIVEFTLSIILLYPSYPQLFGLQVKTGGGLHLTSGRYFANFSPQAVVLNPRTTLD